MLHSLHKRLAVIFLNTLKYFGTIMSDENVNENLNTVMEKARISARPLVKPTPKVAVDEIDEVLTSSVQEEVIKEEEIKEEVQIVEVVPVTPDLPKPTTETITSLEDFEKATEANVSDGSILTGLGSLAIFEAMNAVLNSGQPAVYKVAALQSGYTAEISALAFEDISRIQSSAIDAHAARIKLLKTLYTRIKEFSFGTIGFQDWLKITAQGDYDTLMYGLYAATYPGDNEFDVQCRFCGHENKVRVNVNQLARVEKNEVYNEISSLLDPKTNFKGKVQKSLVGRIVQKKLPKTNIIAEITNPSIQDYLDGVQWFVSVQDKGGNVPTEMAGSEIIRTLNMYVKRLLVPIPNSNQYIPITEQSDRATLIGRLPRVDGKALTDAVDGEVKNLEVSYTLPDYNCASCGKNNSELFLDFEALLFIKLRAKA
jgi:hypothetical protein